MLDKLAMADFENIEGPISIEFAGNSETAVIASVQALSGSAAGQRQPFSVILRTQAKDHYWPQGMHRMVHPVHGTLELFMVPIGPDEQGMQYEVVFN